MNSKNGSNVLIIRICYFGRVADRAANMLAWHYTPPLAISGLLMGLSALSFVYLVSDRKYSDSKFFKCGCREIFSVIGVIFKISCGALVQRLL